MKASPKHPAKTPKGSRSRLKVSAVPAWCCRKKNKKTQPDIQPTCFVSFSLSLFLTDRPVCQENSVLTHNERQRTNAKCSNYAKPVTRSDFCPRKGGWWESMVSLGTPLNSPLSWSVIQQKNGSIKSWSSPCQVTPRKWVLKLFFSFFFSRSGKMEEAERGSVFKVRKWKLCFLMSCLSGCLCVWWSVKCSVTLTKWLSLCSCGFKWPSPQRPYLHLHPCSVWNGQGRNGGHP